MKLAELVMLARVMSQRYGVEVCIGSCSKIAMCSSKLDAATGLRRFTITLPFLKDKGKFDKMIRGYLDHEIGHVQYTDFNLDEELARKRPEYWDTYFRQIWNIFEDVYIEKRMGAAFPGSKMNLRWLARNIFTPEMAFDSVKEVVDDWKDGVVDIRDTVYAFVTVYCLFKRRTMLDNELAHSHKLLDRVRNALASMDVAVADALSKIDAALQTSANSSDETCELARQIWYALHDMKLSQKAQAPQQGQSGQDNSQQPQEQGDGDSDNSQQPSGDTSENVNAVQEMMNAVVDAADGAFEKNENGLPKHRKRVPLQTEVAAALSEMIADGRDGAECEQLEDGGSLIAMGDAMSELKNLSRAEIPVVNGGKASQDMLDQIAMLQSGFMRTIPGLLQSIQFSPRRVGYMGRISGRDLYKTGTGNGRIFQKKAERREQRVDVAILLDASGSMCSDIYFAQITLYAMLGMLKSLPKVRSYAAAFSDEKYVVVSRFADRRMPRCYYIDADGYTPTAGAVMKVLPELSTDKDVRRILFVITDGKPDNAKACVQALKIARAQGVEVYGIGLRMNMAYICRLFGDGNVITAYDVKELPLKLAAMMKNALARAVA